MLAMAVFSVEESVRKGSRMETADVWYSAKAPHERVPDGSIGDHPH